MVCFSKRSIKVAVQLSEEARRRAGLNLPYGLIGAIPRAKLLPIKALMLVLFFAFSGVAVLSYAEEIMVPKDATLTISKDAKFGPINTSFLTYSTAMNKGNLTSFYRKALTKEGWAERKKPELYFTKGNKYLTLIIMPNKTRDNKTQFSIVIGDIPTEEMMRASQKDTADKLSFMPVYPKAAQTYLWDTPTGVIGGYRTSDDIRDVVLFYKSGMLNYGWSLYDESPVSEKKADCPECEKGMQNNPAMAGLPQAQARISSARLLFRRGDAEACILNIYGYDYPGIRPGKASAKDADKPAGLAAALPMSSQTQIIMSYNAKKKITR